MRCISCSGFVVSSPSLSCRLQQSQVYKSPKQAVSLESRKPKDATNVFISKKPLLPQDRLQCLKPPQKKTRLLRAGFWAQVKGFPSPPGCWCSGRSMPPRTPTGQRCPPTGQPAGCRAASSAAGLILLPLPPLFRLPQPLPARPLRRPPLPPRPLQRPTVGGRPRAHQGLCTPSLLTEWAGRRQ